MRRLIAIAAILVILAGAWTAGWFWLASWVDGNFDAALAEVRERGIAVECADRTTVGFPFAMRVQCSRAALTDPQSGVAAEVPGASGGASVLSPTRAELRLESPARVAGAPLLQPAELRWEEAAINVGIGMSGPRALSFDTSGFTTEIALADLPKLQVSVAEGAGSAAVSRNGGTALAATFSGLAVVADGVALPPFDGQFEGTVSVSPRALAGGDFRPPISAEGIHASLSSGDARIDLSGSLTIDAEGVLDGEVRLQIAGTEALPTLIEALPERYRKHANAAAGGLIAFGRPTTLDGRPASELTVTITRGEAEVGPVEVTLPRLLF